MTLPTFCPHWKVYKSQRELIIQVEFSMLRPQISSYTDSNIIWIDCFAFLKVSTNCASNTRKENDIH